MRKKRYFWKVLLFCSMLIITQSVHAMAATGGDCSFQNGRYGDRVSWRFENHTLTISGTGYMSGRYTYDGYYDDLMPPWNEYSLRIYSVKVTEGVVYIGKEAFAQLDNCREITIAATVDRIGQQAFQKCTSLTEITLPAGITLIGERAFDGCSALKDIYFEGSKTQWDAIDFGYNAIPKNVVIHYDSSSDESSAPFAITSVPTAEYGGTVTQKELADIDTISVQIANLKGTEEFIQAGVVFYDSHHRFLGMGLTSVSVSGENIRVQIPIKDHIADASHATAMKVLLLDNEFRPLIASSAFTIYYENRELTFFPYL